MARCRSRRCQRREWPFLFPDAHVGYITWEEYEANRQQLRQNRQTFGGDRRHGPPREGPALLQGLVICGKCGNRMTIRYHQAEKGTHLIPEYVCQQERVEQATEQTCQHILGAGLDAAKADLLLAQVTPFTIDTALQVYEELHTQVEAAQHLRDQQVERARYAAELAQRRFLRVDPENRLVASVLEAEWNARLQEYSQVQEQAQQLQAQEQRRLSTLEQQAIANLVEDFPRVWHDERTLDRDRKRMVRLLLDDYTDAEVAEHLNQRGWRTYEGKLFHATRILSLRRYHQLKDHGMRLRERGLLSASEAAHAYGVCPQTIREWGRAGRIPMYHADSRGIALFSPPDEQAPRPSYKTRYPCGRSA